MLQLQFFCFVHGDFKVRTDVSDIKISVTLLLLSATARTSTQHLPVIHAHPVGALIRYNGFFNPHGKWVQASRSIAGSRRTLRCLHTHLRERFASQDCPLIFKYAQLFRGARYISHLACVLIHLADEYLPVTVNPTEGTFLVDRA